MDKNIYNDIEHWFNTYAERFSSDNTDIQKNIALKKRHIFNTVEIIQHLADWNENYSVADIQIAKILGVLHNISRFAMFANAEGASFLEEDSNASIAIIREENVLAEIPEAEKERILNCLSSLHLTIFPKSFDSDNKAIIQLVTDACRLSTLEIVAEYYGEERQGANKVLEFNLPNKFQISTKLIKRIMEDKVVEPKDVHSIKDLKLMQMSWVFALHFKESYKIIYQKSYLKKIYETLPKSDKVIDLYRNMRIFLENQL